MQLLLLIDIATTLFQHRWSCKTKLHTDIMNQDTNSVKGHITIPPDSAFRIQESMCFSSNNLFRIDFIFSQDTCTEVEECLEEIRYRYIHLRTLRIWIRLQIKFHSAKIHAAAKSDSKISKIEIIHLPKRLQTKSSGQLTFSLCSHFVFSLAAALHFCVHRSIYHAYMLAFSHDLALALGQEDQDRCPWSHWRSEASLLSWSPQTLRTSPAFSMHSSQLPRWSWPQ